MKRSGIAFLIFLISGMSAFSQADKWKLKELDKISNPVYLKRTGPAWEGKSRIVGTLKNAPEKFEMLFYRKGSEKLVHSQILKGNLTVYETYWLEAGNYIVVIKAEGYRDFKLGNGVELKPSTDCVMDITFGTVVYNNRL